MTIFLIFISTITETTFIGVIDSFTLPIIPDLVLNLENTILFCIYYATIPPISFINLLKEDQGRKIKNSRIFIKSYKDLNKYTRLVLWICQVPSIYHKDFMFLSKNIEKLWRRSGNKFAGLYLKSCLNFVNNFLNHSIIKSNDGEIMVRSRKGLPLLIPNSLRKQIIFGNLKLVSAILTLFSVYRCIKWKTEVNVESIISPWNGTYRTVPMVKEVLDSIGVKRCNFKITYVTPITSGPGGKFSVLQSGIDASAILIGYPRIFWNMIKLSIKFEGGILFSFLLVLFSILNLPLYFFSTSHLKVIGRLGLIEEGAGKIRVVAMLDWWTQCLFKDLHDHIYNLLKDISNDGTKDQEGPLNKYVETVRFKPTSSFDLSAATDRLPVDIQKDILNVFLPGLGDLWGVILTERGYYAPWIDTTLFYKVGQPMGAYSSFAMLALSHHYLVRYSAFRIGKKDLNNLPYVLLGDDISLGLWTDFFDSYKSLMIGLGVQINLFKSIVSFQGNLEFTKRLFTPHGEFSPIGARSILMSLNFWYFIPSLILDSMKKHRTQSFVQIDNLLMILPKYLGISSKDWKLLVIILLSPIGLFKTRASEMIHYRSIQKTYLVSKGLSILLDSYLGFLLVHSQTLWNQKVSRHKDLEVILESGFHYPSLLLTPGWYLVLWEVAKDITKIDTPYGTTGLSVHFDETDDPSSDITNFISKYKLFPGLSINIETSGSLFIMKRMVKQARAVDKEFKFILDSSSSSRPGRSIVLSSKVDSW